MSPALEEGPLRSGGHEGETECRARSLAGGRGPLPGWHTGVCLAEPGPTWELSLWPTEGSGKGRSSDEPELGITAQGVPAKVTVTKAL